MKHFKTENLCRLASNGLQGIVRSDQTWDIPIYISGQKPPSIFSPFDICLSLIGRAFMKIGSEFDFVRAAHTCHAMHPPPFPFSLSLPPSSSQFEIDADWWAAITPKSFHPEKDTAAAFAFMERF